MKGEPVDATLPPSIDHRERIFIPAPHQLKQVQITGSRWQIHHLSVKTSMRADINDSRDEVEKFQKVGITRSVLVSTLYEPPSGFYPIFTAATKKTEAALAAVAILTRLFSVLFCEGR